MIGHGFVGALQAASYVRPPIRTTGTGAGSITETAAGYDLTGFADTAFAWLDAPKADGKWYWEATKGGTQILFGIADDVTTTATYGGYSSANAGVYSSSPQLWVDSGWTGGSTNGGWAGGAIANGDVLGFALNLDSATKALAIYQNGVQEGLISWTAGPSLIWPLFAFQFTAPTSIKLGPGGCAYAPPAGYAYL